MGQMSRHCRQCGLDQLFDQPHEGRECCPDVPDGDCLEWACTECGAALLIGIPALMAGLGGLRSRPGRAA